MVTGRELLEQVSGLLRDAGLEDTRFEAGQLLRIAGLKDVRLEPWQTVNEETVRRVLELADRRLRREPLQYLAGEWDFWDYTLAVGPGVLIPRPETELCAMTAAQMAAQAGPGARALDLCSGTGAIALGIALHGNGARVTAVELSEQAFGYLTRNDRAYGGRLELIRGDVLEPGSLGLLERAFDVIASNPPYVTEEEYRHLAPELYFEPKMALTAPREGLLFYERIAPEYRRFLKPGGWLVLEIGEQQGEAVAALCRGAGYESVRIHPDLEGRPRMVTARLPLHFDGV